uniref:MIF4G domain-containing protein n=1 Tax=viral metagenome TaxID=1070528 RepID=A0A6C0F6F2_9ZZZZ|tara:strand:+ start:7627 stop:8523 length:897 start_codon:yes stop_codon:yes gene_type:complete
MLVYKVSDFINIEKNNTINELNKASIDIINAISKKVGAPTYRKTPVFRKKKQEQETIINGQIFKKTKFINKIDEDEINLDKIRESLNKLTRKNYNQISKEIIMNIKHFIYSKNKIILISIGKSIFDISSVNKFWVKIYAELFNELIKSFPVMKEICIKNFDSYMNLFNNIEVVDEKNYDNFCKVNKTNEKRRSLTDFYTKLFTYDILSRKNMFSILFELIKKMKYETKHKNVEIMEEIFENINIILSNIGKNIENSEKYTFICEEIIEIYNLIDSTGISKKLIFKLSDLFEELDIEYE